MLTNRLALFLGTLLVLGLSRNAGAAGRPGRGVQSIQVIVNPFEGSPHTGCEAPAQVETERTEWWVGFAQAKPHPERGWEATGSEVWCGRGSFEKRSSDSKASLGVPYLIARVSTGAALLPSVLTPERVLVLNVSLSVQKLSGFEEGGEPAYQQSELKRSYHFLGNRDAFIPIVVANDPEIESFGIREVLLKVTAGIHADEAAAAYGVVSVLHGVEGAELLLDGGRIGATSAGGETVLRNVPVGQREVRVRDSLGQEIWQAVRVEANRTVLVDLDPPGAALDAGRYRLVSLGVNPQGYQEFRRGSDGAVVVKIPAGEFLMGNKDAERTPLEHRVYVSDFLMDKTAVTWGQLKRFLAATGVPLPPDEPYWGIHDDHPAVYVTWEEARAYCEWAGGRLPTEAEREKAARGTDNRTYPWGDDEPDPQRAVFRHEWGWEATEPVGAHPSGVSPYGLLDMGGNVWEWCSDWYDEGYYAVSPAKDPRGPSSGVAHVVRGGSWDSRPSVLSCSVRNWGYRGYREGDFGFRCAMNSP